VLNAPVGELNFKNVINKLGDIMYKFPFSLPPFYIAIIRCLGVLEGLAIQVSCIIDNCAIYCSVQFMQVDSEFRIINDAYPYIASRLLTDPSEELQAALRRLLFNETKLRWDRLEELIERASSTSDYDVGQALDILVSYIFSDNAKNLRISIQSVLVELLDEVGEEAYGYAKSISFNNNNGVFFIQIIFEIIANAGRRGGFKYLSNLAANAAATLAENATRRPNSYISSAAKFVTPYLRAVSEGDKIQDKTNLPNSIDTESFLKVSRRILREPTFREMMTNVANELGDRAASRLVRSWFGQQYRPKDSRDTTTVLPTIR
jgi:aarF domain-containing kinase